MIEVNEILYWAALGNAEKVQQAIFEGHDVNSKGIGNSTALHAAALNNHVKVVQFLLDNGAHIDAQLTAGETPLELARLAGMKTQLFF